MDKCRGGGMATLLSFLGVTLLVKEGFGLDKDSLNFYKYKSISPGSGEGFLRA